jgi:hypothetical protein
MHPAVQISQSFCQSGFILLPGHSIHSRRRFSFQCVEAVAQQCLRPMMEQRGELLFLPLPCCLTHACQTLGHARPVLCRVRMGRTDVLLDPRPFLSPSAEACASLFGRFSGITPRSDSSGACIRALWLLRLSRRSAAVTGSDVPEVSRFPCMKFLSVRALFDCAELSGDSPMSSPSKWPSLFVTSWALRTFSFAAQSPGPPMLLSTLR